MTDGEISEDDRQSKVDNKYLILGHLRRCMGLHNGIDLSLPLKGEVFVDDDGSLRIGAALDADDISSARCRYGVLYGRMIAAGGADGKGG